MNLVNSKVNLERWWLCFCKLKLDVIHRSGISYQVHDALSRLKTAGSGMAQLHMISHHYVLSLLRPKKWLIFIYSLQKGVQWRRRWRATSMYSIVTITQSRYIECPETVQDVICEHPGISISYKRHLQWAAYWVDIKYSQTQISDLYCPQRSGNGENISYITTSRPLQLLELPTPNRKSRWETDIQYHVWMALLAAHGKMKSIQLWGITVKKIWVHQPISDDSAYTHFWQVFRRTRCNCNSATGSWTNE